MYDLEVATPTHNFLLTNGVVTSNSHSYAYSFITARQLWLMAYYPLEFYTAMLMCEKDFKRLKEIKIDANLHGIEVAPIHINKSRDKFSIQTDDDGKEKIFYGFSNLMDVGESPAARIIQGQPYVSFEDFMDRFGNDGTVFKALISLNAFRVEDRLKLYKYYEYLKDWRSKKASAAKRYETTLVKYDNDLGNLLKDYAHLVKDPNDMEVMNQFTEPAYELWEKYFGEVEEDETFKYKGDVRTRRITVLKRFHEIRRKRDSSIGLRATKEQDVEAPLTFETFEPSRSKINLDPEVERLFIGDTRLAERKYYGYQWHHVLEESPDYDGFTIDKLLSEDAELGCVEVEIKGVTKTKSKKSEIYYYVIDVEDANGREIQVTMWEDDFERFGDDLKAGNLVKMHVNPPQGSWSKYSFESVPRHLRRRLPNKDNDHRLCVMRRGEKKPTVDRSDEVILLED
jgi:DNA polymerase III alpha subunit